MHDMHFYIDPECLRSYTITDEFSMKDETPEDVIVRKLKGLTYSRTFSKEDPVFTDLREMLGAEGYIRIERGWWNGDSVLKPFYLNGVFFKLYEQFPCADALKFTLQDKKRRAYTYE
jgi:hypothetical protein